jgi:hypothetical protein
MTDQEAREVIRKNLSYGARLEIEPTFIALCTLVCWLDAVVDATLHPAELSDAELVRLAEEVVWPAWYRAAVPEIGPRHQMIAVIRALHAEFRKGVTA